MPSAPPSLRVASTCQGEPGPPSKSTSPSLLIPAGSSNCRFGYLNTVGTTAEIDASLSTMSSEFLSWLTPAILPGCPDFICTTALRCAHGKSGNDVRAPDQAHRTHEDAHTGSRRSGTKAANFEDPPRLGE